MLPPTLPFCWRLCPVWNHTLLVDSTGTMGGSRCVQQSSAAPRDRGHSSWRLPAPRSPEPPSPPTRHREATATRAGGEQDGPVPWPARGRGVHTAHGQQLAMVRGAPQGPQGGRDPTDTHRSPHAHSSALQGQRQGQCQRGGGCAAARPVRSPACRRTQLRAAQGQLTLLLLALRGSEEDGGTDQRPPRWTGPQHPSEGSSVLLILAQEAGWLRLHILSMGSAPLQLCPQGCCGAGSSPCFSSHTCTSHRLQEQLSPSTGPAAISPTPHRPPATRPEPSLLPSLQPVPLQHNLVLVSLLWASSNPVLPRVFIPHPPLPTPCL